MIQRKFFGLFLCCTFVLSGCETKPKDPAMEKIRRAGTLVVLTRNAPTTYFEGREGPEGFEYRLTQLLGRALQVKVEYVLLDSVEEVLHAIDNGEGDLAAAGLTRTDSRAKRYRFGPGYKVIQQQVVCHRDGKLPKKTEDLPGVTLEVVAGNAYGDRLDELKTQVAGLKWTETDDLSTDQVLERVFRKQVDCTVADSHIVALNRRYFPDLTVAFALSEGQPLAWVLPKNANYLAGFLEKWFSEIEDDAVLERLNARYYGYAEIVDYFDPSAFSRHVRERLPSLRPRFEKASVATGIPWKLLAALSYQESRWNPKARLPLGRRGMMMLSRVEAERLGVHDPYATGQSIMGGARYLARFMKRLPEGIVAEDRHWFALAAYSIGLHHLEDARSLAGQMGKNADSWEEMQTVFPLLSVKKYFRTLKYGYARGWEPVTKVRRIRDYLAILEREDED
ncbi:MAG: membrane-bound lytic murein transglycosylase MltF [Pseudomonadota bacterium]